MDAINLVTQRSPEQLKNIIDEHVSYLLYEDFILLNSPMGPLLVDKQHKDFEGIVKQCIVYCRMFGDKKTAEEYEKLIPIGQ